MCAQLAEQALDVLSDAPAEDINPLPPAAATAPAPAAALAPDATTAAGYTTPRT